MARFGVLVGRAHRARAPHHREPAGVHAGRVRDVVVPLRPARAGRASTTTRRSGAWHAGRSLPKRQFSDERALFAPVGAARARRRPILRLATVVGVVALLLARRPRWRVALRAGERRDHGSAAVADDSFEPSTQPAFRDSPWTATVLAEQSDLPGVRDAYLGYRLGDSASQYTNVVDGERLSYRPAGSGRRVSVWFFGGSALFGDGQRDAHTIPSEFARRAESDGIPSTCTITAGPPPRCGRSSSCSSSWSRAGSEPDLVVFYDGFNDLAWQLNLELTPEPTNYFDPTTSRPTSGPTAKGAAAQSGWQSIPGSGTTVGVRRARRLLGPERVAPRVRRTRTSFRRGCRPAEGAVREGCRSIATRADSGARRDHAGGRERDLDPGTGRERCATSVSGSVGPTHRSSGSPTRSPRSSSPTRRRTAARHLRTRTVGSRGSAAPAEEHAVRRSRRRARLGDAAGAVGLRAHQRGGRSPGGRSDVRPPRTRAAHSAGHWAGRRQ